MNLFKLKEEARNINWSVLLDSQRVNEKVNIFTEKLIQLSNILAPLLSIKIKQLLAPWLTEDVRQMTKKCLAKSKYKRRPTNANLEKYVYLRNLCNKMCSRNVQHQLIHS